MKTKIMMILLAGCGALALSAGCNQNEAAAPAAAKEAPPTAAPSAVPSQSVEAAEAAKAEAMKQQAAADQLATEKAAAAKTAAEKLAQTTATAAQEQDRIQSLIDTAKNLTGQPLAESSGSDQHLDEMAT